uniref:Uncharacterized protein n=1 Tax=Equus caballus TaxID=9796 RepID=A0A3Q2I2Q1_HORSE
KGDIFLRCSHLSMYSNHVNTSVTISGGCLGAMGLLWATDWQLILDWMPCISGKFKKDD